jgi:hypothetical protein
VAGAKHTKQRHLALMTPLLHLGYFQLPLSVPVVIRRPCRARSPGRVPCFDGVEHSIDLLPEPVVGDAGTEALEALDADALLPSEFGV